MSGRRKRKEPEGSFLRPETLADYHGEGVGEADERDEGGGACHYLFSFVGAELDAELTLNQVSIGQGDKRINHYRTPALLSAKNYRRAQNPYNQEKTVQGVGAATSKQAGQSLSPYLDVTVDVASVVGKHIYCHSEHRLNIF